MTENTVDSYLYQLVEEKQKLLRANHMSRRYALEDQLIRKLPNEIASMPQWIDGLEADMALLKDKTQPNADGFCWKPAMP